jgi:hypothetical protein
MSASSAVTLVSPQWETPLGLVAALDRPVDQGGDPGGAGEGARQVEPAAAAGVSASTRGAASATAAPMGTLTNSTHRH